MNLSHQHAFDARLEHRQVAQPALTAAALVGSKSQRAKTRTEYITQINVETIAATGNQEYRFVVELSNDGFTTIECAEILSIGGATGRLGSNVATEAGDQYQMYWCTEVGGQSFQDWRIQLVTGGAGPSIAFSAFTTAC